LLGATKACAGATPPILPTMAGTGVAVGWGMAVGVAGAATGARVVAVGAAGAAVVAVGGTAAVVAVGAGDVAVGVGVASSPQATAMSRTRASAPEMPIPRSQFLPTILCTFLTLLYVHWSDRNMPYDPYVLKEDAEMLLYLSLRVNLNWPQTGINRKIVQERLVHSSINITLDTYSDVVPRPQDPDGIAPCRDDGEGAERTLDEDEKVGRPNVGKFAAGVLEPFTSGSSPTSIFGRPSGIRTLDTRIKSCALFVLFYTARYHTVHIVLIKGPPFRAWDAIWCCGVVPSM